MAFLSRQDIENIGARVFADYKRLPRFQGQYVQKVEPEILAKELCALDIGYFHLSRHGTVLGLTSSEPTSIRGADDAWNIFEYPLDGKTILIEKSLREDVDKQGRFHFTLAHEVAHQVLDRLYPRRHRGIAARIHYSMADQKQEYPIRDWAEWQANALASTLLMPLELVMDSLSQVDLMGGIKRLNKVFFPQEYEKFCQVAETLEVSKQALSIRLTQLGMLGESDLDNPYRLVDVEV